MSYIDWLPCTWPPAEFSQWAVQSGNWKERRVKSVQFFRSIPLPVGLSGAGCILYYRTRHLRGLPNWLMLGSTDKHLVLNSTLNSQKYHLLSPVPIFRKHYFPSELSIIWKDLGEMHLNKEGNSSLEERVWANKNTKHLCFGTSGLIILNAWETLTHISISVKTSNLLALLWSLFYMDDLAILLQLKFLY